MRKLLFLGVIIGFILNFTGIAAASSVYYNGHEYALTPAAGTWFEAEAMAVAWGGHLVTINDADEQAWLESVFPDPGPWDLGNRYWIGLNDIATEGHFVWISGEASPYRNWHPDEPNNDNDEDAVVIWRYDTGVWNDETPLGWNGIPLRGIMERPMTTQSAANYDSSGDDGDPVNTFTGELFNGFPPDLSLSGPMPLYFSRYYASGLKQSGSIGRLGDNWRHNFEWYMSVNGADATATSYKGKTITFSNDGSTWNLIGNLTVPYLLVESGSDYILYDPHGKLLYTFDSPGNLVAIGDGRGNTHTLAYSGGDLSTVTDGLGRTLTFIYSAGKLSAVSDGTRTVSFGYAEDNLTSYTDALGNVTLYASDIPRRKYPLYADI